MSYNKTGNINDFENIYECICNVRRIKIQNHSIRYKTKMLFKMMRYKYLLEEVWEVTAVRIELAWPPF